MLLQKGANINVKIYPNPKEASFKTRNENQKKISSPYKYLPAHFKDTKDDDASNGYSLFEGIVRNGWLGITYLALDQMERFGMLFANAIEVAFHISQLQFAKTLINKQVNPQKLNERVSDGRNLICSLSFEMYRESDTMKEDSGKKKGFDEHIMEDILDMLTEVGVSLFEPDDHGCTPFHYACLRHNLPLIKYIVKASGDNIKKLFKIADKNGRTPLMSAFWNYTKIKNYNDTFYKVNCGIA